MLFKNNNSSDISEDQIALIEYAQSRIKSKRRLFFHFSLMIISIISLLTSNLIFEFKKEIVFLIPPGPIGYVHYGLFFFCSTYLMCMLQINLWVKNGKKIK